MPDNEEAKRLLDEVKQKIGDSGTEDIPGEAKILDDDNDSTIVITDFDEDFKFIDETENEVDNVMEMATAALDTEELIVDDIQPGSEDVFQQQIEEVIGIYEAGDLQRAKSILIEMDKQHPEHNQVSYYLQIIEKQLDSGKSKKDQEKAEELFKKGMDELERDHMPAAEQCFDEVVAIKPDFQQAVLMLEKIREMKSSYAKTEKKTAPVTAAKKQSSQTAAKTKPGKPTGTYPSTQQKTFSKFIPIGLAIVLLISLCYFFIVKYPEIRVNNHLEQAKVLMQEKELSEALAELKAVHDLDPSNGIAWEMSGIINLNLQKGYEAVIGLQKALEQQPESTSLMMKLGDAHFLSGNFKEAQAQFLKASRDLNLAKEAYYKIGLTRLKMNRRELAVTAFNRCIELDSNYAQAYYQLVRHV